MVNNDIDFDRLFAGINKRREQKGLAPRSREYFLQKIKECEEARAKEEDYSSVKPEVEYRCVFTYLGSRRCL